MSDSERRELNVSEESLIQNMLEETISPAVLQMIGNWILRTVQK